MKKLILLFTLTILFIGCKKDNDTEATPSPLPENNNPEFSAVINGTLMYADSMDGAISFDTSTSGTPTRTFGLLGKFGNYDLFPGFEDNSTSDITIISFNSLNSGAFIYYVDTNDSSNIYFPSSSTFSITFADTIAKKVSGNFSGIAVANVSGDTVVITNGKFKNISYSVQ